MLEKGAVDSVFVLSICKTTISVDVELSYSFFEEVGVHQVLALNSLFYKCKVLTEDVWDSSLIESVN